MTKLKILIFGVFYILFLISCADNTIDPMDDGSATGTLRDVEGNIYQIVRIGGQWWMAENLKTTKYRNGEWIINVTGSKTWQDLKTGAYCCYGNDFNQTRTFGNLYNWYAVQDHRQIAPAGWHVPTDEDWQKLMNYLGGSQVAGEKMKSTGMLNDENGMWLASGAGGTNESNFSALPGGFRSGIDGTYAGLDSLACFWSSTESGVGTAWHWHLTGSGSELIRSDSDLKQAGYSIRCVKD